MELLNKKEIISIIQQLGLTKLRKWHFEDFEKNIGHRGDHLKLIIETENNGITTKLQLFVKCLPRFDKWKREYLRELKFFYKEYVMLSQLFEEFQNEPGADKWRPRSFYIREDLFVSEDVSRLGYEMPHFKETMTYKELKAAVKSLARFHSQTYIYEDKRSKELGRAYRVWDEFSDCLHEPIQTMKWRNTGRNAAIDFLKTFSKYKSNPGFVQKLEEIMPTLYDKAIELMKPSDKYRNAVVHRDLWANNIFLKNGGTGFHALIVDFQTVLYTSPLLDLSSLIYFNTSKADRDVYTLKFIRIYYETLSAKLEEANIDIDAIFPKDILMEAYDESLVFGMTQASIIVPMSCMSSEKKDEIFGDPIRSAKVNLVSRSQEFIDIANEDSVFKSRVIEILDEIVERYILDAYLI